jgi:steroid delta-isomerase-like uncharacterized protein
VSTDANKALVRRYYEDMWNRWDLSLARELLTADLRFRGSLGAEANGIGEFCAYARSVWLAFPDFHNEIEDMVAEGERVAARLTYTGTHRGEVLGIGATGRSVSYEGVATFRIHDGRIAEVYVVADRLRLVEQLRAGTESGL